MMSCSVFRSRFTASLKQDQLEYAVPGKALPSRVAQGYMSRRNGGHVVDEGPRMSGAIDCWGMLWSEECLMASLTATPRSGVPSGAGTVFMASTPFLQLQALWYAEFVVKPLYCYMWYSNISCDPCIRLVNRTSSLPHPLEMLFAQGGQIYADA